MRDRSLPTLWERSAQALENPLLLADASFAADLDGAPEVLKGEKFWMRTVAELRACEPDFNARGSHPEDVAVMMLTSGSTGMPKRVVLSHRNLLSQAAGSVQKNGFSKEDISLNWVPIDRVAGLVYFHIRDVYLGSRQIHFPLQLFLQEPLVWLDAIDRFRVTIAFGPNFAYGLVNDRLEATRSQEGRDRAKPQWDLSSIRCFLNGAETIVAKTARRFLQELAPCGLSPTAMRPSWGMAEVSSGVTFSDRFSLEATTDSDRFVGVGAPIPGVDLRIVDDKNRVVGEGEIGSLQVRGLTVTSGYDNNPEANQKVFAGDGWFETGDLGFLRDGELTIAGRQKDTIIIYGENYYSHDIEAFVEEIDGICVTYVAACAVRSNRSDTDELAIFFSAENPESDSLKILMQKIQSYLVERVGVRPSYLIPVAKEMIPKTAIGKIQRRELKKRFEAGAFDRILASYKNQPFL